MSCEHSRVRGLNLKFETGNLVLRAPCTTNENVVGVTHQNLHLNREAIFMSSSYISFQ